MSDAVEKVCAVVVTFNPDASLVANIQAILNQVHAIIIVDNSTNNQGRNIVNLCARPQVTVISNNENCGLAFALNQGVKRAIELGYEWIATFDQDSRISERFFEKLFSTYRSIHKDLKIGIMCPLSVDEESGRVLNPSGREIVGIRPVLTTITSGNLISSEVFRDVGYYDESLFIDYIDHDFCLRLKKYGYNVIECSNSVLFHTVGQPTWHRLLWLTFMTTNHSAQRRYFNTRNRMTVYIRYFSIAPTWVIHDFWMFVKETVKIILVEEERVPKICAIVKGWKDSMRKLTV